MRAKFVQRTVVLYRDPRAPSYSSFRRGFAENLRQCAIICEEQLTYLASQLQTLPAEAYQIVAYESFCATVRSVASDVAAFCGFPEKIVLQAVTAEGIKPGRNAQWCSELSTEEKSFLESFFDSRRTSQWCFLLDAASL